MLAHTYILCRGIGVIVLFWCRVDELVGNAVQKADRLFAGSMADSDTHPACLRTTRQLSGAKTRRCIKRSSTRACSMEMIVRRGADATSGVDKKQLATPCTVVRAACILALVLDHLVYPCQQSYGLLEAQILAVIAVYVRMTRRYIDAGGYVNVRTILRRLRLYATALCAYYPHLLQQCPCLCPY